LAGSGLGQEPSNRLITYRALKLGQIAHSLGVDIEAGRLSERSLVSLSSRPERKFFGVAF